ncbi:hypothetical protein ASPVEDRAFT_41536 [Aspergillus versicolor CBS 583.65]|uniref:DUF1772 domain-containing protein n=1 Tax=Aspergillus versicolor CBS 583.65 TaxID=1036611 RepID=A0A1L9PKG2_ASPVE|nr:uncharacterized protein ASPVEDRAFT_41536 [Aspergillus versicolor CBS 583.65]OJJ02017.1 hypothetical protein ASPVEDRAFT_41536 [Aspergillus versicolor CBS 583.65]
MSDLPTHFRVAQVVGTLGASWISGNMGALSLISVPALMRWQSEEQVDSVDVARYFKRFLAKGGINPALIALVSCTNGYLAWSYRPGGWCQLTFPHVDMMPYLAGAALTLSIIPFTIVTIIPINKAMAEKAEEPRKGGNGKPAADDTQELLGRWVVRNGARSLFALVAAGLTLTAAL